jgi:hypothetical protein
MPAALHMDTPVVVDSMVAAGSRAADSTAVAEASTAVVAVTGKF